jgi:hypothetical protein
MNVCAERAFLVGRRDGGDGHTQDTESPPETRGQTEKRWAGRTFGKEVAPSLKRFVECFFSKTEKINISRERSVAAGRIR